MAASYPNGTYSPSAKANGNTIQAAWFNDPDSEIVAIEDGLRTGLQHGLTVAVGGINQSASTGSNNFAGPSTLATLAVAGGSTFAGPVTMSSGLTVTGGVTVDGLPLAGYTKLVADLTHGSSQTVPVNTWTGLSWNTETLLVGALHSTSVNSSRITMTSSGVWHCGVHLEWESNSTGFRRVQLLMNDTTVLGTVSETADAQPAQVRCMSLASMARAASTTAYLTARVFSNDATAVSANSSNGYRFWAYRVSA